MSTQIIYAVDSDGETVYVGQIKNLKSRIADHRSTKSKLSNVNGARFDAEKLAARADVAEWMLRWKIEDEAKLARLLA